MPPRFVSILLDSMIAAPNLKDRPAIIERGLGVALAPPVKVRGRRYIDWPYRVPKFNQSCSAFGRFLLLDIEPQLLDSAAFLRRHGPLIL
jgi:hypothetical protein